MTDPAIYSLRFANRLDLGNDRHKVATDASRLVKRFQADWMSEGRRPAGVCGACLLVAARMNGHHRTPEEIAQIVKVSPTTIKRRLLEFAQTGMADKTVEQWKKMTDEDLKAPGEMQPPVVKQQEIRDAKRRKFNDGITKISKSSKSRSRSQSTRRSPSEAVQTQAEEEEDAQAEEERKRQSQLKQSQMQNAIEAAVAQLDGLEGDEEEETDLAPPAPDQYVRDLDAAGDNPEIAQNERIKAIKKFKRYNKVASTGDEDVPDVESDEELEELAEGEGEDDGDKEGGEDGEEVEEGDEDADKEEKEPADDVEDPRRRLIKFENFDDPQAVRKQIEERYMPKVRFESALTDKHMEDRLSLWMGVRDPLDVMYEFEVVNRALRARDKGAKATPETEFDDVDDDEIDGIWMMEENEQRTRARMWLSHNGKWLEDSKGKLN
jgi:transcription factor IIIB subunit 2